VVNVAQGVSGRDYVRALGERLAFEAQWRDFFRCWDVLISPTTLVTAFGLGRTAPEHVDGQRIDPVADGDWYPTCFIANVLGAPAISIPCGVDGDGLPTGMQLMGRPGEDALVLAVAAAAERLLIHQSPGPL
jgi:Asp-tRNA(Asn)/Glu-tRNA(Gln) amidotransferase A subunit family amidase